MGTDTHGRTNSNTSTTLIQELPTRIVGKYPPPGHKICEPFDAEDNRWLKLVPHCQINLIKLDQICWIKRFFCLIKYFFLFDQTVLFLFDQTFFLFDQTVFCCYATIFKMVSAKRRVAAVAAGFSIILLAASLLQPGKVEKKHWVRPWIGRREALGVYHTLFQVSLHFTFFLILFKTQNDKM